MKDFFSKIWHGLTITGRIIFGVIIIALIILGTYLVVKNNKDKKENEPAPEVAQSYEPQIGSPLPADVNTNSSTASVTSNDTTYSKVVVDSANSGDVKGVTTSSNSNSESSAQSSASSNNQTQKVAPTTGVNPNAPVVYSNDSLNFTALLPAGTQVSETNDIVTFKSKSGELYYVVTTVPAGNETLQSIKSQLQNSTTSKNIFEISFSNSISKNFPALSFTDTNFGSGLVVIKNTKIYYLVGNYKYFPTFSL